MSKKKGNGHLKIDRQENEEVIGRLRHALANGERFLSTDLEKGGFTQSAMGLIEAGKITLEDVLKVDLSTTDFSKLTMGIKIEGIPKATKRSLIQTGVDKTRESLFKNFGVRL
ncbi:MAG: hypothetical protein DHS20C02_05940 [Micavibrio sp.]|nr:MAG: hypothetical protein DHS20C02_05940 [Micavibrio sp.]